MIGPAFEGDVRLVNGPTITEGRVEIYFAGEWASVCDHSLTDTEGIALCHYFNYPYGYIKGEAYYGKAKDSTSMLSFKCPNNTLDVRKCSKKLINDCSHQNDAGIVCKSKLMLINYAQSFLINHLIFDIISPRN